MTVKPMPLLLAVWTLVLVQCSGDGSAGVPSGTGGTAGVPSVTCDTVCDHVAKTSCSPTEQVQSVSNCSSQCAARRNADVGCPTEFDLFVSCCAEQDLSSQCAAGLSFDDCQDPCKQETETLERCEAGAQPSHVPVSDTRCADLCGRNQAAQCPQEAVSPSRCVRLCEYQLAVARDGGCGAEADAWTQCLLGAPIACSALGAVAQGCDAQQNQLGDCESR